MSLYWLIITCSWLGTVNLQRVPHPGTPQTPLEPHKARPHEILRPKRFIVEDTVPLWAANMIEPDQKHSLQNDELVENPFIIQELVNQRSDDTSTDESIIEKKSFSPWGGKRGDPDMEYSSSWKRSANLREPSMPKRVRFSPWGGKRSGQVVFKPTSKDFKFVSQYSLGNLSPDRHSIKLLALGALDSDGDNLKDSTPFKRYLDGFPKAFRMGQPYSETDLTKNGKRKAKFSVWGGKRSAPVIGPIWTPAPDTIKEALLDAILLVRNKQKTEET